jgi:tetratricopeptide (TPR) repeat protein
VRPSPHYPAAQAIPHFGRGSGAARGGNPGLARGEIPHLVSIRDALQRSGVSYWARVVDAKRLAVEAWIAHADGRHDDALRLAAAAAELEEQAEKHAVTPGPILPARELEGDLHMSLDRHAEALRSYEKTLQREPNRARATFGAARAAELAGDLRTAERHYVAFADLMTAADRERPELQATRAFLARR